MRHLRNLPLRPFLPETLVDVLSGPARLRPRDVALRFVEEGGEEEAVTYRELWEAACAVAARLMDLGLESGERVLLVMPTSRQFVEHFFGVLVAGGVPVAAPPPTAREKMDEYRDRLKKIVADSQPALCLGAPRLLLQVRDVIVSGRPDAKTRKPIDPMIPRSTVAPRVFQRPDPSGVAFLRYGTDGTRKAALCHRSVVADVEAIRRAKNAGPLVAVLNVVQG